MRRIDPTLFTMADEMSILEELLQLVGAISSISEGLKLCKKECAQLVRRLKLIAPLIEEVADLCQDLPQEQRGFKELVRAVDNAKQLVALCRAGPKLYLVLEKDTMTRRFQDIASQLSKALDLISLDQFEVSDEAREQFDLVRSQLKRVKTTSSLQEVRLRQELLNVLSHRPEDVDQAVLSRLADGLQLRSLSEIRKECQAVQDHDCDEETREKLLGVVKLLRSNAVSDSRESSLEMARVAVGVGPDKPSRPIPEDFRCPITLELMKDPVIVATGQTYDRPAIQKWLEAGHSTCPKTQQQLPHLVLTPNYVLRSVISQWCEKHGIDLPKRSGMARTGAVERATVDALVKKLDSADPEVQKAAAGEIRLLVKRIAENRDCIADAGAIPPLVKLLASTDPRTQEHAVTALLNLSINDNLKRTIARQGAIDPVVEVLRVGSMEARENAAATLFSLSNVNENKATIGASPGGIPALVDLLRDGSVRGKKDAATAIYNLSLLQENKARAVRAGAVPLLMNLMRDATMGMVGGALATLALLAVHPEGLAAIESEPGVVQMLLELVQNGSAKNQENAAGILHLLCSDDPRHLIVVKEVGGYETLTELAQHGTARARRKASSVLEKLSAQDQQEDGN